MGGDVGRLLALCEEALTRTGGARTAFLDEACAGDADLRRAVEALLAEETFGQDFLQTSAWGAAARPRIEPGRQLGPYEILSLVGAGAMGEVYKGRDTRLDRTVAIKVLPPSMAADPARRARFSHEGRAVSALNHPHVCTLFDVGSDDGIDYLVLEYLEGETLAARLARGALDRREALDYALQIGEALASAHAHGFIHRDLKPANVMITAEGTKLLDFGIAKAYATTAGSRSEDPSLTVEGVVLGTIAYMAPEQLRGAGVDARSDIFAFGAMLYEMLTGARAFQGASQTSVIAAVLSHDPPPVSTLQPGVPPGVDELVGRCLAKDPAARWQSADEVVAALKRIRDGRPHPGSRRRLARTVLVGGAVIALAAGAVALRGLLGDGRSSAREQGDAAAAAAAPPGGFATETDVLLSPVTREPGAESFPSLSPDGREFVYATGPLDFFGESDIQRRDVGFERPFNLTPDSPGADVQPAFSPDGNLIAFRSDRDGGGIFIMGRDGGAVRRLTRGGYNPAWSPDGKEIAYATTHTMASPFTASGVRSALWVVNVETGATRRVRPSEAAQPAWSPHGYRLAYWALGKVSTCTPDGNHETVAVESVGPGNSNWNPVWSRDGRYLYFISDRNGPMHLWRVRIDERSGRPLDNPERAPVQMPSTFVAHPAFDASGQRLVFASVPQGSSIQRVELDRGFEAVRGDLKPLTVGSIVAVWPEPSPDGTRIAFHTFGDAENIYVSAADGSAPRLLIGGDGVHRAPRWSPDGRRIAFYSSRGGRGDVWVVEADGANLRRVTRSETAPIIYPAWSPDGRMSASEAAPGSRSFLFNPDKPWEEPGNVVLLPPPDPQTQFVPWSWSPTGDRLAGLGRPIGNPGDTRREGILVLTLATGKYARVTTDGAQPTPVWLPDGRRLLYAVNNRLRIVDIVTGRSRDLLDVGAARIESAAGGGFSVSARTRTLYVAPVMRDGDIWFARPRPLTPRQD